MVMFEFLVIAVTILVIYFVGKTEKQIYKKFGLTFLGVLLFEYFTQALWINTNLTKWAYLYLDVSWVITLGWTSIIIFSVAIIDKYYKKSSKGKKFIFYIILSSVIGIFAEIFAKMFGVRDYSPELQQFMSGIFLPQAVPIEVFYYIPVFMALIIAFKKYWEINLNLDKKQTK